MDILNENWWFCYGYTELARGSFNLMPRVAIVAMIFEYLSLSFQKCSLHNQTSPFHLIHFIKCHSHFAHFLQAQNLARNICSAKFKALLPCLSRYAMGFVGYAPWCIPCMKHQRLAKPWFVCPCGTGNHRLA